MANILCVAAHPDDEVLGCGGTLARHIALGDNVRVLFVADGVGARKKFDIKNKFAHPLISDDSELNSRLKMAKSALAYLGVKHFSSLNLPDNQLDTLPLLHITQAIEGVIQTYQPDIVYTHFYYDLNIDHQITARAVLTACRPLPDFCVKRLLSFEVASSSEWSIPGHSFIPNVFVDIGNYWQYKKKALQAYNEEMREAPHARSFEALESIAITRGASVGLAKAEAFMLLRDVQVKTANL